MKLNKQKLRRVLYIYIALMIVLAFSSKTIYNLSLPKVSAAMPQSGRLTKELEARGVIAFSETFDIYAAYSGQIDELLIKKGDLIDANNLIAVLKASDSVDAEYGLNIERIENQLAALALNRTAIEDKIRALDATQNDLQNYQYAIEDARTALEKRQAALTEARESAESEFDGYSHQQAIDDAERELTRKKAELLEAETALAEAKQTKVPWFDDYSYQNAIDSAKIAYNRSQEDYNETLRQYDLAVQRYYDLLYFGADEAEIAMAQIGMDNAQATVTSTKRTLEDAERTYENAVDDLNRAKKAFDANMAETRETDMDAAQKRVSSAQTAVDDAQRIYDRTINERVRAVDKAGQDAQANIADAETAVNDAQAALTRAETNLELARKASSGQAGELRKSFELELKQADLNIANVNIDLRAAKASAPQNSQVSILSDYSGVIVSIEKAKGQFVAQGEKVATVGVNNSVFICDISCSESDGRFIEIGDEASIHANGATSAVKAFVYDITPVGDTLKISLTCETDIFIGGEYVSVKFHKQTGNYDTLVPNEAIVRDAMGNYVWIIQNKQGALGAEYYSTRVKVLIADSDDYYTAIAKGLEIAAPVVVSNDKDLTVNGRVNRME